MRRKHPQAAQPGHPQAGLTLAVRPPWSREGSVLFKWLAGRRRGARAAVCFCVWNERKRVGSTGTMSGCGRHDPHSKTPLHHNSGRFPRRMLQIKVDLCIQAHRGHLAWLRSNFFLSGRVINLWHGGQGRLSRPFLKTAARVANGSVHVHVHSVCWFRMHTPKYMYSTCNVSQSTTYSYTGIHLYIYSCPWIHPVGVRGGAGATTRRSGWSRGSKRTREAPHSTG